MRVAFATQGLARIDAHFGWARHLMIYDVSAEGYAPVRTISFRGDLQQDGGDRKLAPKLRALRGCSLVFVSDIGVAGEARLAQSDIRAIRRFAHQPIAEALDQLIQVMRTNPAAWLRRQDQKSRRSGD